MSENEYVECPASECRDLIFTTPRQDQGQDIEVSWSRGIPAGHDVNYDAAPGDRYKKIVDHFTGVARYYRRTS